MFIDTHAHLQWEDYKNELSQVLENAAKENIEYILNVGTTIETSRQSIMLAQRHDMIFASIGIHPHDAQHVPPDYIRTLGELAKDPKVIAIGEIGLDYFYKNSPPERQRHVFREQMALARDLKLPLSIHCRNAFEDCFRIIDEIRPQCGGVFHCFTGSEEDVQMALKRGFFISISGIVTFRKSEALQVIVKEIPLENILIETDCPYLAPDPFRGKRNEPAYVVYTARRIAELKNISLEMLGQKTTENAKQLFHFQRKERR